MKKIMGSKTSSTGFSKLALGAILCGVFSFHSALATEAEKPVLALPKISAETAIPAAKPVAPLETLQDKASLERGRKMVLNKCMDCHTFDEGGPDRFGPNLFGIVGAKYAHKKGYPYSKALMAQAKKGKVWSEEELSNWLESPPKYIVGTKMLDGQISDEPSRNDIIGYLKTIK